MLTKLTFIKNIDLYAQYLHMEAEMDQAIKQVIRNADFIQGSEVKAFELALGEYLEVDHVIGCGNGTDALQLAFMALDLQPGDEVILPAFTYAAVVEVALLLGLTPVLVDVNKDDFNIDINIIEAAISPKTKALVPVHLFGQGGDMALLMQLARHHNLWVVEDNAQSIGAQVVIQDKTQMLGTIGHIGTTSFFPTKNLGAYGDGGALFTQDEGLAKKMRMLANHGQSAKYQHEIIGVNSRLDTIQAAILRVKLTWLDHWTKTKQMLASVYDELLKPIDGLEIPYKNDHSTHVYHQYTIKVKEGKRDGLKLWLHQSGIESMIYYPKMVSDQQAYANKVVIRDGLSVSQQLCAEVLSLPIHPAMDETKVAEVCLAIKKYFER